MCHDTPAGKLPRQRALSVVGYLSSDEHVALDSRLVGPGPIFYIGDLDRPRPVSDYQLDGRAPGHRWFRWIERIQSAPLTAAQTELFFGTAPGDIGLSLLRTEVPDDGSCSSVSAACAGEISDIKGAVAHGVRVWSTPWSPPASMKTNASTTCTGGAGNGALSPSAYGSYATYLSNYIASLQTLYSIDLYALSVQNEPDNCPTYDGARWTSADFDTFIKDNLGPTLAAAGQSSTLLMMPESSQFSSFASESSATMGDSTAAAFVGINAWHDYDHATSVTNPYASLGKRYWETEASAGAGFGPSLCTQPCFDPSIADALMWAAIVDDRMAVANANAWHYWWLVDYAAHPDNEGLIVSTGATTKRAFMLGNYSMFVRPGYHRIDATHAPQSGVTISAYQNLTSGTLVVVATNQNSADASQTFDLANAPVFRSMTPWVTSATLDLVAQSSVTVASSSFSYALPAMSITTFVGVGSAGLGDAGTGDAALEGGSDASSKPEAGSRGGDAALPREAGAPSDASRQKDASPESGSASAHDSGGINRRRRSGGRPLERLRLSHGRHLRLVQWHLGTHARGAGSVRTPTPASAIIRAMGSTPLRPPAPSETRAPSTPASPA